jgi:hypothetical protein
MQRLLPTDSEIRTWSTLEARRAELLRHLKR